MTFFLDWELWAKMCFVLGCLILIVLLYATGVQIRNRQKIKRLLRSGNLQIHRRGMGLEGGQIPFGARALESGIQIEGIWISKPNTPIPSQGGTPVGSRPASPAPGSSLDPSSKAPSPLQSNNQSSSSLRVSQNHNAQPVSTNGRGSSSSSNAPVSIEDHTQLELPQMTQIGDQSRHLQPLNGDAVMQQQTAVAPGNENDPRASLNLRYPLAAYVPQNERLGTSTERTRTPRPGENYPLADENHGDLQSLYSHRRYHAAEIGQLGGARNQKSSN